jgi:uncharacterized RDD family membrane protein YckC
MFQHGGFWRRVLAYIIDTIILSIVGGMISGSLLGSAAGLGAITGGVDETTMFTGAMLGVQGISFVINWLYFALLESSSMQGTLGKKALGMIVTDLDGNRIGFGRATGRYFAKFLSAIILLIGFVMVAFTQRKQGLHDIIASTLVYKASSSAELDTSAKVFE